jgi:hypothetical protein
MLANVDKVYNDLVEKHEKFTELVEDDQEFEAEERWLEECQQQFLSFEGRAKNYIDETQKSSDVNQSSSQVNTAEEPAENNSEIVESTQKEALNVKETLQVETLQVTEKEISQVAKKSWNRDQRKWKHRKHLKIPSPRITLQKCVRLKSRNLACLNSMEILGNTQYSNRILNILLEQNTATEMQLHFYVRRLLENR